MADPVVYGEEKESEFSGTVAEIRHRNPQNCYTILCLEDKRGRKTTVLGTMPFTFAVGMSVTGKGVKTIDPKWGEQIKVISIEQKNFSSKDAIINYLSTFSGIGRGLARQIVTIFGDESFINGGMNINFSTIFQKIGSDTH